MYPTKIGWPYVAKYGQWTNQYVVDINYYGDKDIFQQNAQTLLNTNAPFHDTLIQYLMGNIDQKDKNDKKLYDTIDSWKESSQHVCMYKFYHTVCI